MVHTQYNWCWHHVPTFAPYKVEGIFYPLILAHGSTAQSAKTGVIVLQSLTPNAQNVFKALAEHQLANPDEEGKLLHYMYFGVLYFWDFRYSKPFYFSGMPINDLYRVCRERFLVSSQVTLNSHLTEFKDHELVKTRRNSDGQDCLHIPLTTEAIEKLLLDLSQ